MVAEEARVSEAPVVVAGLPELLPSALTAVARQPVRRSQPRVNGSPVGPVAVQLAAVAGMLAVLGLLLVATVPRILAAVVAAEGQIFNQILSLAVAVAAAARPSS
jgi:hypothetical protein